MNQCGFFLEARDFPAKQWVVRTGDGHTGDDQQHLKDSEDDHTQFVFTWLKLDGQGGWTTHYRWKEEALSDEGQSVLQFLGTSRIRAVHRIRFRGMSLAPRATRISWPWHF